jgi:hypothetical protein
VLIGSGVYLIPAMALFDKLRRERVEQSRAGAAEIKNPHTLRRAGWQKAGWIIGFA